MDAMGLLMNGDIDQAEKDLKGKKSPFHQVGGSSVEGRSEASPSGYVRGGSCY
jgi:hypothetical protein